MTLIDRAFRVTGKVAIYLGSICALWLIAANVETAWGHDMDYFKGWWGCFLTIAFWPALMPFGRSR